MRVGFVGLGRMGFPMVSHIMAAGHDVVGFDLSDVARTRAKEAGIDVASGLHELADVELVCSSLPATEHVEAVFLGDDGLASLLGPGTVCADMSTISIAGSRAIADECEERGVSFLDAPVSGTSIHAEAATLVVMVGGADSAFDVACPVLDCFATEVAHVGGNGTGLELKLITNRLLTTHLVAIAEAIVSIEKTSLSMDQCIDLLRAGAVPRLLDYKAGPLATRDFTPMFTVDLMRKDLRLAADELAPVALATAAHEIVEATSDLGLGDEDLAALITIVEQRSQS
jgi:3-hydroxyisobutyrate dehydrogenase-like beta-hydroxyacid dehydrogenase